MSAKRNFFKFFLNAAYFYARFLRNKDYYKIIGAIGQLFKKGGD